MRQKSGTQKPTVEQSHLPVTRKRGVLPAGID